MTDIADFIADYLIESIAILSALRGHERDKVREEIQRVVARALLGHIDDAPR